MTVEGNYLASAAFELERTKRLGDGALAQLADEHWHWRPDQEANSIAILVQHLHGNMRSRWTDFLTSDGEKPTRQRDAEFEDQRRTPVELRQRWEEGWSCCLEAVRALTPADLLQPVRIRGESLTVLEAVNRQISHYAYHVGQMVSLARGRLGARWRSLSIPRGRSAQHRTGRYKSG
ncbi:MAG: DinB family protein [Planctomycetota bacterium]